MRVDLVAMFVVFGVDTRQDVWCHMVASLACVRPPQKRERAENEERNADANSGI